MATLNLNIPATNEQVNINVTEDLTAFSLNFDLSTAVVERVGSDFVITFDEAGASIVLEGFYNIYNSENMPEFVLDSETVSGEDFFAALSPDLMPAAGNADVVQETNRQLLDANLNVASGVSALGGTDGGSEYNFTQQTNNTRTNSRNNDEDANENFAENVPPSVSIVIPGYDDNVISKDDLTTGPNGGDQIKVEITLDEGIEKGDDIEVKDSEGNTVFEGVVDDDMINNGLDIYIEPPVDGEGTIELEVTVTDEDGVEHDAGKTEIFVDVVPPVVELTVNDVTFDDTINIEESEGNVNITGSVTVDGEIQPGDVVTVVVNGNTYQGTVDNNGNFSVSVNGADLAKDPDFTVSVTSKDAAGNSTTVTNNEDVNVDVSIEADITMNDVTADNVINAAESGADVTLTGQASGDFQAGDKVTITVNGKEYTTEVDADGNYSVDVSGSDLAADSSVDLKFEATDAAGNKLTVEHEVNHTVDLKAEATVTVDNITNDDVINAAESGSTITVTGKVTGEFTEGNEVSFEVNGETYTGTLDADGNFSVDVAGSDLAADPNFDVTVTVTDKAGNTADIITSSSHEVDLKVEATVEVDNITNDDVINAAESGSTITVTGKVTGEFTEGNEVSFEVNGTPYTGTLDADGNFSVDVAGSDLAADPNFDVTVTVTDKAGNTADIITSSSHEVDLKVEATVEVDNITNDDVINAAESGSTITVTGKVTGEFTEGNEVSFEVNGETYTGTLDAEGNFSVDVAGSDLAADPSFDVNVTVTDKAGNTADITTSSSHEVDLQVEGSITLDEITTDSVINADEAGSKVTITGTVSGEHKEGTITVNVNGTTYEVPAENVNEDGSFNVEVEGSDLAKGNEVTASVTTTDAAGNTDTTTATEDYTVDTEVTGTITIDPITDDNTINNAESAGKVTVTGTVTGELAENGKVTITVNGTEYETDVNEDGSYSVEVEGSDLAADKNITATVEGTDGAGNTGSAKVESTHDVDTMADGAVTVKITNDWKDADGSYTPEGDGIISESEAGTTATGYVTVKYDKNEVSAGDTVKIVDQNGNVLFEGELTDSQISSGHFFQVELPEDGETLSVTTTVTDAAGNEVTGSDSAVMNKSAEIETPDNIIFDEANLAEGANPDANALTTSQEVKIEASGDVKSITIDGKDILSEDFEGTISKDGLTISNIQVNGPDENGDYTLSYDVSLDSNVEHGDSSAKDFSFEIEVTDNLDQVKSENITITVENDEVETLTVDSVTDDNILNTFEASGDVAITGKVDGDFIAGDKVTIEVNGKTYEGSLDVEGNYSVNVSGNELSVDHEVTVTVVATDSDGNEVTLTETKEFTFKGDPLADDFVSINEGARVEGSILSADEVSSGLSVSSINAPDGWDVQANADGSFTLTYDVDVASKPTYSKVTEGTYTVEIAADGTFTYTGPTVLEDVIYDNINSIIDVTVVDQNGVEHDTTVTFANNAATQDNLLINGDFTGNTVEVTNRDSNDNTTYDYSTADYTESSGIGTEQSLSGFFLGENNDTIEVTGTVGYGEGKAHHIYGDELYLENDGGHDDITVGELAAGGHIRGDGNVSSGLEGGDDTITVGTMTATDFNSAHSNTASKVIGDGWAVSAGAEGGDDTISVDNIIKGEVMGDAYSLSGKGGDDTIEVGELGLGKVIGDGYSMTGSAQGGDDTINVGDYSGKGFGSSYVAGDAYIMGEGTQGGDDTINIDTMNGQSVYGDAYSLSGVAGNDTINVENMVSGSITGDGSHAYGTSVAGDDTYNITNMSGGIIYGDSYKDYAGVTEGGDDTINVDTMSGGTIYADSVDGIKAGGNDTVSVKEFVGNAAIKIDGGAGNDTFVYDNEDGATIDFSQAGSVVVKGSENATITNFENLSTGSGNDMIKVSSTTASAQINTGEGFDIVYSTDAAMEDLLANDSLTNVEMLITGGNLNGASQESMLEDLGITQDGQNVEFGEGWTITGTANGGSIYSNGETEVWVKDPVNTEAEIGTTSETADGAEALVVANVDFDGNTTPNGLDALEDYADDLEDDISHANDYLTGDGSNSSLILMGLDGDDMLQGEEGHDILIGGTGEDSIMGGDGDDDILGGDGDDVLEGGDGDDIIEGGAGADHIKGGQGDDVLIGGEDGDVFSWDIRDDGDDTIEGFTVGEDTLDLTAFDSDEYDISAGQSGNDSVITISKGGEVQLEITLADVAYNDDLLNDVTIDSSVSDGVTK